MEYTFTQQEIEDAQNIVELDDQFFHTEKIEGDGKHFVLYGKLKIEDETYPDTPLEIELEEALSEPFTALDVLQAEWDWYDYVFIDPQD